MVPESLSALTASRRPLLLQGPMGPFFSRLADYLAGHGLQVRKVNFNGGDEHFYRRADAVRYADGPAGWEAWLRELLVRERIDAVVLFGQARPLHKIAIEVARELDLGVFVFEEGYFRPHYVTLEQGGVNGHTSLPQDAEFYWDAPRPTPARPSDAGQRFGRMAWYAMRYATATALLKGRYPRNVHHRELGAVEAVRWVRGGLRKAAFAWRDRNALAALTSPAQRKRWFLLPLQVHNDAQLVDHSPFGDVPDVIRVVMTSFAEHAPASAMLVLKHHPMDRAYRDYTQVIDELTQRLGLAGRVRYVHDLHLPTLLKHVRGVVTVNSTTGLQAMYHGTPVCVLGDCLYALPGLVHTDGLASFWHAPAGVEPELYLRFQAHVVKLTQLNASFYGKAPALEATAAPAPAPLPEREPSIITLTRRQRPQVAAVDRLAWQASQPANDDDLPQTREVRRA